MALFGKSNSDKKTEYRYPNPLILVLAAIYLGFMAYNLARTIFDGSASGVNLAVSWIGMIAFIVLAVVLVGLAIHFDKMMKKAADEAIAKEKAELDSITLESLTEEEEEDND